MRMNQLFIEDVLSDKCLMAVCPMVRCDGELEYQHPVDCCGKKRKKKKKKKTEGRIRDY